MDENPDYDNLDILTRDAEERYFDDEEEEEFEEEENESDRNMWEFIFRFSSFVNINDH